MDLGSCRFTADLVLVRQSPIDLCNLQQKNVAGKFATTGRAASPSCAATDFALISWFLILSPCRRADCRRPPLQRFNDVTVQRISVSIRVHSCLPRRGLAKEDEF